MRLVYQPTELTAKVLGRLLPLIGDVADHIPSKFRDKHPEIDWDKLMGLHYLSEHQDGETLTQRLWITAPESLPKMMGDLEKPLYIPPLREPALEEPAQPAQNGSHLVGDATHSL